MRDQSTLFNMFVLRDTSADEMIHVFKRQLMRCRMTVSNGHSASIESARYFTVCAYEYLKHLIHICTQGDVLM